MKIRIPDHIVGMSAIGAFKAGFDAGREYQLDQREKEIESGGVAEIDVPEFVHAEENPLANAQDGRT